MLVEKQNKKSSGISWLEKLYPEQREAYDFVVSRPATALFAATGSGKTYITMAMLEQLHPQFTLIVAPLTSLDVTWSCLATLPGTIVRSAQELKVSLKTFAGSRHPVILLINPESLRNASQALSKVSWDCVVIDESQGIKDRNSAFSRAARRLRHAPRRLALSGTPLDASPIDVWAQMRFVDYTVFGENWRDFAEEYCRKAGWMGKEWEFKERKLPQFLKALEGHIYRLTTDFMQLKPITFYPVGVHMFGNQRAIYDQMHQHGVTMVNGSTISASHQGVRDVKLSQITGGFVIDNDGHPLRVGHAKERKFKHLVKYLEPPIVVFCQYLHELDAVERILRRANFARVSVLRGSVKGDDRTQLLSDFQNHKLDALVCQTRTGGVSIELTASSTLVLYSINYSYIDFEQIIHRLHRGGQEKEVKVFGIFCEESIDEEKISAIKQKSETSFRVVSHFERR
jgi:SNF2 family DNA or RNA helicase